MTSNIMSLAGIAISIGVLVDGAIVEVENAYKKLELWQEGGRDGDFHEVRLQALKEVGPSVFFSLLVIAVAFLPVFTLVDQEGRLFKPLAYTKNSRHGHRRAAGRHARPGGADALRAHGLGSLPAAAGCRGFCNQVTVGSYYPEEKHPISRILFRLYEGPCRFVIRHRVATVIVAALLVLLTIPVYLQLGSEFMPPLYEGDLLYMPTTLPGISVTEAQKLLQRWTRS